MLYLVHLNSNTEQQCQDWTWNWVLCLDFSLNTTAATQKGLESLPKAHKALRNGAIASADQDLLIFCRPGSSGSSACPLSSGNVFFLLTDPCGYQRLLQVAETALEAVSENVFLQSLQPLKTAWKHNMFSHNFRGYTRARSSQATSGDSRGYARVHSILTQPLLPPRIMQEESVLSRTVVVECWWTLVYYP